MIQGFLHREGRRIVDETGKEFIPRGWGLGNWLLTEGYMWCLYHPRFDRPRRIEQVVEELTGSEFAQWFWYQFRNRYITHEDIQAIARLGYNSVRIPFSYRHFLEDGPGLRWKSEGYTLLDRCLDWCEQEGLYAFLDLHGAPGGQTGANIDDCIDDVPRLFIDSDAREKAIALWKELARRYAHRKVVAGYDLLNEPIAPQSNEHGNFDYLEPELVTFYKDTIVAIRTVDQKHLISLEGIHWATSPSIFEEFYDENMVIHFHRYAEPPEIACLRGFLELSEKKNVPLWLGETGENVNEWYAALYPLCERLGIGYHLWPWKKMDCTNSPCSIRKPKDWNLLSEYLSGGKHPGFEKAQTIFKEYLYNISYAACDHHPAVTNHVFRILPFSLRAVDFDVEESEIRGIITHPAQDYRKSSGRQIQTLYTDFEKKFAFDSGWERFALKLTEGEQVTYAFHPIGDQLTVTLEYQLDDACVISIGCDEMKICHLSGQQHSIVLLIHPEKMNASLNIRVEKGAVQLQSIHFTQ